MDDETKGMLALLGVTTFLSGLMGNYCGSERTLLHFDKDACKLVCERHRAGKVHSVDETYCVCEFGRTFKRDRSRLYVAVGKKQ